MGPAGRGMGTSRGRRGSWRGAAPVRLLARLAVLAPVALLLPAYTPTQPQEVFGPCRVRSFFIVPLGTSHARMTLRAGGSCRFTLFNPDLQVFQTAALVTAPPRHGTASAGLLMGGLMAETQYRPAPGFRGEDRYTITVEPRDKVVIVDVAVGD